MKKKVNNEWLDAIIHSERKEPMPRPTVFKDKSKYDRNRHKKQNKKDIEGDITN